MLSKPSKVDIRTKGFICRWGGLAITTAETKRNMMMEKITYFLMEMTNTPSHMMTAWVSQTAFGQHPGCPSIQDYPYLLHSPSTPIFQLHLMHLFREKFYIMA